MVGLTRFTPGSQLGQPNWILFSAVQCGGNRWESTVGMFSWLRRSGKGSEESGRLSRSERKAVAVELAQWAKERRGVEVFVEPKTAVTGTSVVLVAHDGEFHRRRIASPKAAQAFAHDNSLPIYDATLVGYPQRMRDYSRRQTILRQRADKEALGG
jgi:hypothetical protein